MSIYLKIKAKSLAEEARIIRKEEEKIKNIPIAYRTKENIDNLFGLQEHRKGIVRLEARATHLARTFISGKPYSLVEKRISPKSYFESHIYEEHILSTKISQMARKYGKYPYSGALPEDVKVWLKTE